MDLDSPSTQVKRLAANMCRAAGRMRQLLADLASIARDNVSTAEICDIRELIGAASEAALTAMQHQSVQIMLDVPEQIALLLVRSHIERVFFNLIANAFEAMPGGGTVRIRARNAASCVLVELEDTGPGIPGCITRSVVRNVRHLREAGRAGTWARARPSDCSQLRRRHMD